MLNRCIVRSAIILAIAVSAGASANAQNAVKIGMVMPMTGTLASAGQQVVAGARLYIKQHGDTVAGKRIELIVKDDASSGENWKAAYSGTHRQRKGRRHRRRPDGGL